jgi:hypothetical protein
LPFEVDPPSAVRVVLDEAAADEPIDSIRKGILIGIREFDGPHQPAALDAHITRTANRRRVCVMSPKRHRMERAMALSMTRRGQAGLSPHPLSPLRA